MTQPPHPYAAPGYGGRPPKPGVVPLAPLMLGELFTGVFGAYVRHWRSVLPVAGALALLSTLVSLPAAAQDAVPAFTDPDVTPGQVWDSVGDVVVWTPLQVWFGAVVGSLASGLLAPAAISAMLGEPLGLGGAWARWRPQLGRLLGLAIVYGTATTAGLALLIVPGVILWTFWAFAASALVVERCSVATALRRSWSLVTGQFWRVLGILVLMSVVVSAALSLVAAPVSIGTIGVGPVGAGDVTLLATSGWVTGALGMPVTALTTGLLYIDARIRRERYDLTLARAAGDPR